MNTDIFDLENSKPTMQYRISAEYIFVPSISIYKEQINQDPNVFSTRIENDFVDALALAIFKDGKWESIDDGDLLDLIDKGGKYPLLFCNGANPISAGILYQENDRQDISGSWMSEEVHCMDWKDLTLQAAQKLKRLNKPARICLMYGLVWHSFVDWETGIDEGNFEIDKTYDCF